MCLQPRHDKATSSHQKPGAAWSRFPLRAFRRCQPGQHPCSDCWLASPGHVLSQDGQFLSASSLCSGLDTRHGGGPLTGAVALAVSSRVKQLVKYL